MLRLADVPKPAPRADEILVRVIANTVNRTAVGKSTYGACRRLLKAGAISVSTDLGPGWQNPLLQAWTGIVGGKRASLAIPDMRRVREDVQFLRSLAEPRKLRPVIDRTYPLEQVADAHRYVETEQKMGSVVILVAGGRIAP